MRTSTFLCFPIALVFISKVNIVNAQVKTFEKTFGGSKADYGHCLSLTSDGGLIITGLTLSFGDTLGDTYLTKLDADGMQQWVKIISGPELEGGNSIVQTSDGGYFITNHTESYGAGDCDSWAIKTDHAGNMQWNQTYGCSGDDVGEQGIQTSDGNFVVTGITRILDWRGNAFIVKYNSGGDTLWTRVFNAYPNEIGMRIVESSDGGFVVACSGTTGTVGTENILVLKTSIDGDLLWTKEIGGAGNEEAYGLVATSDGGFVISGFTTSFGSGDADAYLVKLNDSGTQLWSRNYGGLLDDRAISLATTRDGGFIVAGDTKSFRDSCDIFLFKTDMNGNLLWSKTFGNTDYIESPGWIVTCPDGGFAITGTKQKIGSEDADIYLLKTDSSGNFSTNIQEPVSSLTGLKVYPDPAVNTINLSFDSRLTNPVIKIFNSEGRLVVKAENQTKINIEDLPSGLYCITLSQGNRFLSQKFIRE